ncbi:MAG: hypothetical protein QMC86_08360 [Methanothermobacter sp.]|nr:hypothetical protein [Methanothermobacter sp.]
MGGKVRRWRGFLGDACMYTSLEELYKITINLAERNSLVRYIGVVLAMGCLISEVPAPSERRALVDEVVEAVEEMYPSSSADFATAVFCGAVFVTYTYEWLKELKEAPFKCKYHGGGSDGE